MLATLDETGVLDRRDQVGVTPVPASLASGATIGPFTIDAFVGRGGMGEVYRATRTGADFTQRVAIKLLRIDAAIDPALFARERRVLSRLEHPAIVRLIDGGVTVEGRPWFAMDFIEGQAIDRWLSARTAGLEERLRLFGDVCAAVSFAHANLVVHRDLKPANILIDGDGRAHLLDFGIAKLIGDVGDEATLVTGIMMTPEYSAPEQIEGAPVTVATDVHALGVILYELLSGRSPWQRQGSLPTIVRRIVAEDPPLPSRANAVDPPVLPARIVGDLDAIVAKAMRKEPGLRYATVDALAEDLRRAQALLPVSARAGSRRYRLQRFVRRNALAVGAVAAVILAVVAGGIATAIQAYRAEVQRDTALAEARRSDSIVQMLTLMLSQAPNAGDLTLGQALDAAAARALATFDRSDRSGRAINALADLFVSTGNAKGSYDLLSSALAKGIGSDAPVTVAQMRANLADAAVAIGATDEAAPLLAAAEATLSQDRARNAATLSQIVGTRAGIARRQRDFEGAITLALDDLPNAERAYADNDSALLTRYNNLIVYMLEGNRLELTGPIFTKADRIMGKPGMRDNIQAIGIEQLRGTALLRSGNARQAETILRGVVDRRRRLYGDSPGLASDLSALGRTLSAQGRYADALVVFAEALPMALKALGPRAVPVLTLETALAQAHAEVGDVVQAQTDLVEPRAVIAALPTPNPIVPQLALTDAVIAFKSGKRDEAIRHLMVAREGFIAMGTAGAFGLQSTQVLRKRIDAR